MIRTSYVETLRNNVNIEKVAEFEQDISEKYYSRLEHLIEDFKRYKFSNFINGFINEYNCQSVHYTKYYLVANLEGKNVYYGKFLYSSLVIPNEWETEFTARECFDARGKQPEEVRKVLMEIGEYNWDELKVIAKMEIKFLLLHGINMLDEYEQEQMEYLRDNLVDAPIIREIEKPFVIETCSICLSEKSNILLIPCLHKTYCSQCEEKGKLIKCPTCRKIITQKVKI